MDNKELILEINKAVDELDFVSARKLIEDNFKIVDRYQVHLKSNAREILIFIKSRLDSGEKPLTKMDIALINTINLYASKFDVRGLKLSIKGKEKLLLRNDAINYLNADAKTILQGMGTIKVERN